MAARRTLSSNVILNVAGYVVTALISFLIAPVMLHGLGEARYGAWSLVAELIGYYGLLDLGIRGAVTYYIAKYAAEKNRQAIQETLASAFWALAAFGALVVTIGTALSVGFPYLFRADSLDTTEVSRAIFIMSALIGVSLPMNVFSAGLIARERFDITTGTEIATRTLAASGMYWILGAGGGLVALALCQSLTRILYWIAMIAGCGRELGGIFAWPQWVTASRVRELFQYGYRNSVGALTQIIIHRLDAVVVGVAIGLQQVTYYAIAAMLVTNVVSLCGCFSLAFTPRFMHLFATKAVDEAERLFYYGSRVTGMAVSFLIFGMLVFGKDFIRLWLGPAYVSGAWTERADILMVVLLTAALANLLHSVSRQLLFALARVRFLMWLSVCEASANLILSLLLVRRLGPLGVALGTLFPALICQAVVMTVYVGKVMSPTSLWHFIVKTFMTPLLTGLAVAAAGLLCLYVAPPITWEMLIVEVGLVGVIGGFVCLVWGFSPDERRRQLAVLRLRPASEE